MKKNVLVTVVVILAVLAILYNFKVDNKINARNKNNEINSMNMNEYTEKTQSKKIALDDTKIFFSKPETKPQNTYIKIYKKDRRLELYGDDKLIGRFKIALGSNPVDDKNKEGDMKTPEGKYYICTRTDKTNYILFMGISYPNIEDAKRGIDSGLIDENIYKKIENAINNKSMPPWNTALGGAIGIHGGGNSTDWTWGCIALSEEDTRIIWEYTEYGTEVYIYK